MQAPASNTDAPPTKPPHKPGLYSVLILAALSLAGCGGTTTRSNSSVPPPVSGYPGVAISGTAHAGTSPLASATVQLFAAGTTGNGSAPITLGTAAVTDASGSFTLTAGYTCPAAASELYLVTRNGSVALAPGNPALALIVLLGRCDQVFASARFLVNEATTAATAWALSQFLSSTGDLGATGTNTIGLANAVATALALAGNTTGSSPGPSFSGNGSSPAPRINALANLLNTCTSAAANCTDLLTLTGNAPDTLAAAVSLVRNPGANVGPLFNLSQTSTAFAPSLATAPADWTLSLTFTGAGMNAPGPLALDSQGNVWVGSYFGVASKFSPIGTPVFPTGVTGSGLSQTYGLAIDLSDNVWITNENSPTTNNDLGSVTVLNAAGQSLSGSDGFSSGGILYPLAVAIDPTGTAWVIDYENSHLTLLSPAGASLSGTSGYASTLLAFPVAIALDAAHSAWIANSSGSAITHVSADGTQFTNVACCNGASGLALDAAGNIWVANYLGDSVSEVSPAGAVLSTGYTGGGLNHPQGIAVDGAGTIWVANFRGNSISELAGANSAHPGQALSPAIGWSPTPGSLQTYAVAVDASGNLWTSNFAADSITETVGLATPVKTPVSALPRLP